MPVWEAPAQPPPAPKETPPPYPAEKARGAEIILRRPWQRVVFFGGLLGMVLLAFILFLAR
jgi:hypothetical protein